ncbi:protein kinase [Streptomyces odontomachi]|uniref:protein kinase n=1 Tax=Streptomyces odontomachi TaxID=2944940 RepID=UPI00210CD965|nr:protein kinase [Streptomyces sp. ODS25]
MDDYAGRVLADRYRLPLPPSDEYELAQTRAFDTYSGQEVLVRQVPLPEVVEAEVLDADGLPEGFTARGGLPGARRPGSRAMAGAVRTSSDPAVRRAIEAAQAAAQIPDHPRLDQVFDVFAEDGSLWIVSEVVAASPLDALLAESPLSPYRAAEIAADVLTALRALHAHGWVHRNITTRTVLVCDDGRVLLTGLAAGAAEEALCGYDPTPDPAALALAPSGELPRSPMGDTGSWSHGGGPGSGFGDRGDGPGGGSGGGYPDRPGVFPGDPGGSGGPGSPGGPGDPSSGPAYGTTGGLSPAARPTGPAGPPTGPAGLDAAGRPGPSSPYPGSNGMDARAARAGAIAAYRAGARAAARSQEEQRGEAGRRGLPPAQGDAAPGLPPAQGDEPSGPPGQIADPYGVRPVGPWPPRREPDPSVTGHLGQRPGAGTGLPVPGGTDGGEPAGWGAGGAVRRGPATPLAAERARQARMAVVGPVTERWAPEQAGPVHENWQLAPPIGPATDLWALGALLFRAVQGHAPYPEESAPELVEMVCSEPPAFAEECGPLRPVVESLLRQDPSERPDFEELRGWLRSLVRSAPEPEAGFHVAPAPPADAERLPIVRRRGELIRRRKGIVVTTGGRHKRGGKPAPRRLGRTLLALVFLGLAAAVAYAMLFMPKAGTGDQQAGGSGGASAEPGRSAGTGTQGATPGQGGSGGQSTGSDQPQTSHTGLPSGYTLHKDPEGFQIAVANGWHRQARNSLGQVVYSKDGFQLIVVPGRDTAKSDGTDPMVYQREKEHELQPYRDSSWATSGGMRTTEVGDRVMAEGQFTWQGSGDGEVYARNLALLLDGRYHIVQIRGPESQRDKVDALYEQASATYQYTG